MKNNSIELVEKCYLNILNRKSDETGLKHFVTLLESNLLDESGLIKELKNSYEYKLTHPTELDPTKISVNERMRTDWNARAINDAKFAVRSVTSQTDEEFWNSGIVSMEQCLAFNTPLNDLIMQNKDAKDMKVLEIGCGVGRIVIPMSKIFGKVVGIDVSDKMVELAKEKTSKILNCEIFLNNGLDLSSFSENYFDFCYSIVVFQHVPEKQIIKNYIHDVYRILKNYSCFRFQVNGKNKISDGTTWNGISFSKDEIIEIAKMDNFKIIEMNMVAGSWEDGTIDYFTVTFQKLPN